MYVCERTTEMGHGAAICGDRSRLRHDASLSRGMGARRWATPGAGGPAPV